MKILLQPKISNIKGHVKLGELSLKQLQANLKEKEFVRHGNYISLKGKYSYVIFPKNGYVNVTGIRKIEEISCVLHNLCLDFSLDRDLIVSDFIIDNTTATGNLEKRINLSTLQEYIVTKPSCDFTVSYNRDIFSGAFIKSCFGPTVIIFSSGKYNILGSKCLQSLTQVSLKFHALINELWMTRTSLSASTVELCYKPCSTIQFLKTV